MYVKAIMAKPILKNAPLQTVRKKTNAREFSFIILFREIVSF